MEDESIFAHPEYNWCALEKITTRDDMEKLRSLYCDLETPLNTEEDGPLTIRRICELPPVECAVFHGQTLRYILFSPSSDLHHLRILKEYGKILMIPAFPATTQRTGALVYTGAIAQALVRFDIKISSLSYQQLAESFHDLLERPYIIRPFESLLTSALKNCR